MLLVAISSGVVVCWRRDCAEHCPISSHTSWSSRHLLIQRLIRLSGRLGRHRGRHYQNLITVLSLWRVFLVSSIKILTTLVGLDNKLILVVILVASSYLMLLLIELVLTCIFKTALLRWILIMMADFMVLVCWCCSIAAWLLHKRGRFWLLSWSNRLIFLSRRCCWISAVRIFKHLTFGNLVLIHLIELLLWWRLLLVLLGLY